MNKKFQTILVVGASRGVGAAVSEHIMSYTAELITVSRSPTNFGNWIEADISTQAGIEAVKILLANMLQQILPKVLQVIEVKSFRLCSAIDFSKDYFRQQYL